MTDPRGKQELLLVEDLWKTSVSYVDQELTLTLEGL